MLYHNCHYYFAVLFLKRVMIKYGILVKLQGQLCVDVINRTLSEYLLTAGLVDKTIIQQTLMDSFSTDTCCH